MGNLLKTERKTPEFQIAKDLERIIYNFTLLIKKESFITNKNRYRFLTVLNNLESSLNNLLNANGTKPNTLIAIKIRLDCECKSIKKLMSAGKKLRNIQRIYYTDLATNEKLLQVSVELERMQYKLHAWIDKDIMRHEEIFHYLVESLSTTFATMKTNNNT